MSKKKELIALLTNHDDDIYCFRKELIEGLILERYEILISCPNGPRFELMKDIPFKYDDPIIDRRGTNVIADGKLFLHYIKLFKKERPDVVLTYTIKPNIYGGLICRLLRMKYIANITGLGTAIENKGILSGILLFLYKIGLKGASQVFFQNENNRMFFQEKGIIKTSQLIPGSGVNLKEHCYEEYPKDDGEIRFLFVGRIMKDKGIGELLAGAEQLKKIYPHLRFNLAGGYDEESYRDRIEELEKRGIVRYLGRQADIHSIMKEHHAVILPSYHEGLSNVLLEAAACGRPVLTTDVPGCRETFEEGISGIGFLPKSSEALVRAVEKFISLPYDQRKQMGIHGRKKVEREFDRQIVINAYMKEIKGI